MFWKEKIFFREWCADTEPAAGMHGLLLQPGYEKK
jgi:hypothetical protein